MKVSTGICLLLSGSLAASESRSGLGCKLPAPVVDLKGERQKTKHVSFLVSQHGQR